MDSFHLPRSSLKAQGSLWVLGCIHTQEPAQANKPFRDRSGLLRESRIRNIYWQQERIVTPDLVLVRIFSQVQCSLPTSSDDSLLS